MYSITSIVRKHSNKKDYTGHAKIDYQSKKEYFESEKILLLLALSYPLKVETCCVYYQVSFRNASSASDNL